MACNELVELASDPRFNNIIFNPEFVLDSSSSGPQGWDLGGASYDESGGGLAGGGRVLPRAGDRIAQDVRLALVPTDSDYNEHGELTNHNAKYRSVNFAYRGSGQIRIRVSLGPGSATGSEPARAAEVLVSDDISLNAYEEERPPEVTDEIFDLLGRWGLHRYSYLPQPSAQVRELRRFEIEFLNISRSDPIELTCIYVPAVDIAIYASIEVAARTRGWEPDEQSFAEWYSSRFTAKSGAPRDSRAPAPAWAQALALQFGKQLLEIENKIDRLEGIIKATGSHKSKK